MKRVLFVIGLIFAAWIGWALVTLPPAAQADLPALREGQAPLIVRGAYHVHSTASDGTGTVEEIAGAAARAGLDFVILTDHGDAAREPAKPRYVGRVLCIDASEISTIEGHYAAIGMGRAPYPLGGEARDVIEDVARLGGFGVAAHPDSPRSALRWREWDAPFDGLEWLNADSAWREAPAWQLLPALLQYGVRPAETIAAQLRRPQSVLARWDKLSQQRSIVAIAASDAHARFGFRGKGDPYDSNLYVRLPSYEAIFRTFSLGVELDAPPSGDAASDARAVVSSLRNGRVYSAITALAAPARLSFGATMDSTIVHQGGKIAADRGVLLQAFANVPPGGILALLRDGYVIEQSDRGSVRFVTNRPGVYRVEGRLRGATRQPPIPWILSNPIYVGRPVEVSSGVPVPGAADPVPFPADAEWHVEHDPVSSGTTEVRTRADGRRERELQFHLAGGGVPSPFVALGTASVETVRTAEQLRFLLSVSRPMRVSVQLRLDHGEADRRWIRSVYADSSPRVVSVPLADMRVAGTGEKAPFDRSKVVSLLFVVDTVNARPGDSGSVWIGDLQTLSVAQVRTVSSK